MQKKTVLEQALNRIPVVQVGTEGILGGILLGGLVTAIIGLFVKSRLDQKKLAKIIAAITPELTRLDKDLKQSYNEYLKAYKNLSAITSDINDVTEDYFVFDPHKASKVKPMDYRQFIQLFIVSIAEYIQKKENVKKRESWFVPEDPFKGKFVIYKDVISAYSTSQSHDDLYNARNLISKALAKVLEKYNNEFIKWDCDYDDLYIWVNSNIDKSDLNELAERIQEEL